MKNKLILASSLLALAVGSAWSNSFFYFNQVGYDAGKPISIIVKSDSELEGAEFKLMSSGNAVQTGKLSKGTNPDNWVNNGKFYVATLERGVAAGSYTLQVTENGQPVNSGEFKIAENALATATLGAVLDYFYDDRAVNSTIVGWDSKLPVYKSDKKLDVHGGWYDASGDVSKYLSHLSYANYLNPQQIPLTAWVLAHTAEHIPTLLGKTTTKAKTAEEAAFGADFLVRMLDEQGFFYMTVFDVWGNPLASRELCAFTGEDGKKTTDYQTAFREGGGMAIAALARVSMLRVNGDFTSEQYLDAAKKAYAHLSEKQSIGGNCAYCDDGKENIIDDYTALLAATELYAATGEDKYKTDADKRAASLTGRLSTDGYFWSDDAKTRPFWHASDAGLPLIALIRYAEVELNLCTGGCSSTVDVNDAVKKHYNWLLSITNKVDNPFGYARQSFLWNDSIKDGFFIPHVNESKYWWQGEDARLASLAAAAVYAFNALDQDGFDAVDKYATDQLDWILGKNPYATCMMYGFGTKVPAKYDGQSDYDATLKGGIANGITGKNSDGSGIAWDDDGVTAVGFPYDEPWNNWRWVEQWLPHSTWYLMALATRYDEKDVSILPTTSVPQKKIASVTSMDVRLQGRVLSIDVPGMRDGKFSVVDVHGAKVAAGALHNGGVTVNLESVKSGVYMVKVAGLGAKRIVVR
ncbi:glycoside hydrolase family 9 protein [Fibrobacter sp. UBA4309]|uniref:glycoside hydrolase family 9 protein n=1 Tax=Fibrobacter sp. UBA4309 TaxID=1946537 RepID=UPI0025C3034A|nr:glycoside hydrolase family 9 protein [Fibrobacter sp. UBA4309]